MPELRRRTSPSVSDMNDDGGIVCGVCIILCTENLQLTSQLHTLFVKLQYVLQCFVRNYRMKATVIVIVIVVVVVFLVQLKKDNEDQRNNNQMIVIIRKYHQLIVHREEGYLQLLFPVASY